MASFINRPLAVNLAGGPETPAKSTPVFAVKLIISRDHRMVALFILFHEPQSRNVSSLHYSWMRRARAAATIGVAAERLRRRRRTISEAVEQRIMVMTRKNGPIIDRPRKDQRSDPKAEHRLTPSEIRGSVAPFLLGKRSQAAEEAFTRLGMTRTKTTTASSLRRSRGAEIRRLGDSGIHERGPSYSA